MVRRRVRDLRDPGQIRIGGRDCVCCKPSGNVDWRMQETLAALALRKMFDLLAACAR